MRLPAFGSTPGTKTTAEVMADLGGPLGRTASDAKFDRYRATFERLGFSRWAVADRDHAFLGYAGILPGPAGHPLGEHVEIGWRLVRNAWGHGYASEAARAALTDAFERCGFKEILAYTAPDNVRSRRVMGKLGLIRSPSRDFAAVYGGSSWSGLVWTARNPTDRLDPGSA